MNATRFRYINATLGAAVLLSASLAVCVFFSARRPMTDADVTVATQQLTRWALGGQTLTGNEQPLHDLNFFKDRTIILSFSGVATPPGGPPFVPERSVEVHDWIDAEQLFREKGYEYAYITVEQQARGVDCVHFRVSIRFGSLGGQGYDFTVTKGMRGLKFDGTLSWIS